MPWGICRAEELLTFLNVQDHSLAYPHYAFDQRERAKWAGEKRPEIGLGMAELSSERKKIKSTDRQSE